MKTHTRMLRSLNLGSEAHSRRVSECQARAVSLWGASNVLKGASWTLTVALALSSNLLHAQPPTCVAPGCNSIASDAAYNTAMGTSALVNLIYPVYYNTASGAYALYSDTTGSDNTASGFDALYFNTSGSNNDASGATALYSNTTGKGNVAHGVNALYSNTTGIRNLGIGNNALYNNNGSYNTALGFEAGYNVTTGSNNIEIGTSGNAADNNSIQIGVQGTQTLTTIAGIYGTQVTGSAVYVTSTGQLGVQGSSERFKTDIMTMPELAAKLNQLHPVTFHYKTDPKGVVQYGLIAEEVDKVYP
jgi:Chaperone of endosialidase